MNIKYYNEKRLLVFEFNEEIDHHITEKIRRKIDYEIQRYLPKRIIFDFNSVTFMDSSGIGMLIGRYKVASLFR